MATEQQKLDKQLVKAAGRGDIPAMAALLDKGANINGYGGLWQLYTTPLGSAAWNGRDKAIEFLLQRGAKIDADDMRDVRSTALMTAIRMNQKECVDVLLRNGASTDAKDHKGRNALDVAVSEKNTRIGEMILRHIERRNAEAARAERAKLRTEREKALQQAIPAPPAPPQEDPDIVIFRQKAGDRVLEDVFNFASLERLTLVRGTDSGPVESMLRENFADMKNRAMLGRALKEHARRGGRVTEKDIFPEEKPKLSLPGAAP